ncbi:MAG TPA: dipeptidyl carboxypeptidase II, partial [Thermoanaerobaculia bacterium]|nr:dipeptidyl carboxypeptidase II [Thermoanaerobaculia bacterium]
MKHTKLLLTSAALVAASACTQMPTTTTAPEATPTSATTNPFLAPSPLQYQAPLFDKIKDSDYKQALEEGMKQNLAEINSIANSSDAPTFANTIEAMERSGALFTRTAKVFFNLTASNTSDAL